MNEILNAISIVTGLSFPHIDEFDSLADDVITAVIATFRNIFTIRLKDQRPIGDKEYLLHGVALIGVRSVVGVDNRSGSPFTVQRSLHIPNLTEAEVKEMYHWYERESGQHIESEVIDRIWQVTRGQPGLVSWFGELLTEQYNKDHSRPLGMEDWNLVYSEALHTLPNNSIINLVSKARTEPYRQTVLELFRRRSQRRRGLPRGRMSTAIPRNPPSGIHFSNEAWQILTSSHSTKRNVPRSRMNFS